MSKILVTQLTGLLQRIQSNEEEGIEETARLLAQASVGEGAIYFACFDELEAIYTHATFGEEQFDTIKVWTPAVKLTSADRVCIFTPYAHDKMAIALAQSLEDEMIPFAVVTSAKKGEPDTLLEMAYTTVRLHVRGGLVPSETGERLVVPHLIAALFAYEAIKLNLDEMLQPEIM